jgi:hypothetical protein
MRTHFLNEIDKRPLLCDGAMGTMIYAKGVSFERCFDELNLSNPAIVADIQRAYIEIRYRISIGPVFLWPVGSWTPHFEPSLSPEQLVPWGCGWLPSAA